MYYEILAKLKSVWGFENFKFFFFETQVIVAWSQTIIQLWKLNVFHRVNANSIQ